MKYILAHDFGTSADKAVLFTTDGRIVETCSAPYQSVHLPENRVEQDAHTWWRAFCENTKTLLSRHDPADVLCVSFSGTAPNCLCVDQAMQPLSKAMIWQDNRARAETDWLNSHLPAVYLQQHPGGKLSTDRMLPKLLWVRDNQPEVFARTWKVLPSVASYIILRLTGEVVCDYGAARTTAMLTPDNRGWADEILRIAGIPRGMLPELTDRTAIAGTVRPLVSEACGLAPGTPVAAGTIDNACTAIGAGVLRAGDVFLCGGTSASIEGYDRSGRRVGRATSASGGSVHWLKDQICRMEQTVARETGGDVFEVMNREIEAAAPGSGGVMFQPYLAGARSVFNDPDIKGSFIGITLNTTRNELMRSVIEGIGFDLALILQEIRDGGTPVERMPIVGGLGSGAVIRQIFADIMNVELVAYAGMNEAAAVGAAVLGGIAMGVYPDESAVEQFLRVESVTRPDPENHALYERLRPRFQEIYRQLRPIYRDS